MKETGLILVLYMSLPANSSNRRCRRCPGLLKGSDEQRDVQNKSLIFFFISGLMQVTATLAPTGDVTVTAGASGASGKTSNVVKAEKIGLKAPTPCSQLVLVDKDFTTAHLGGKSNNLQKVRSCYTQIRTHARIHARKHAYTHTHARARTRTSAASPATCRM